MKDMNNYVTHDQLEEALQKNNDTLTEKITKNVVDQMSDVMGDMMQQIDARFNKVEKYIEDIKDSIDRLVSTLDGFAKRLEDVETKNTARDAQFA